MSLLQEINETSSSVFEATVEENIQQLEEYVDTRGMNLGELERRFAAAVRGLDIANRMRNPVDRKNHLSRVITNLSLLMRALRDIHDKMGAEVPAGQPERPVLRPAVNAPVRAA